MRMAISGGLPFLIIFAICLVLNVLIYYPFFKVADNKALEEEKAAVELEGSETA
ncbi:PTS system, cellobiose-specific IIC component [Lactococcus cremoris subsp. cremoris A76]|uniref:PTS system cellobiose-specific transporter subunit IIC n=1 Tax=Lactococcus lactis subsp. cremoris TaxID=1359 RepID=UPI000238C01F|nr:PTS system cellobiose-specific transporter subunit IIC [Lactococcus cremoris]AEU40146.1 PTS system, cellobiose-specific IIC component [Lactococcus cremoris subsp. cremoris A76]